MKDKRFFDYVSSSVPKEQETVYSPEIMLTENNAFTLGKSPVKTKSSLKSNKEMEPLLTFSNKTKGAEALKQEGDNSTVLPPKSTLNFNAQGIENSLRNELDGYSYFGNDNYPEYVRCI